jgi:hypothetical protein
MSTDGSTGQPNAAFMNGVAIWLTMNCQSEVSRSQHFAQRRQEARQTVFALRLAIAQIVRPHARIRISACLCCPGLIVEIRRAFRRRFGP